MVSLHVEAASLSEEGKRKVFTQCPCSRPRFGEEESGVSCETLFKENSTASSGELLALIRENNLPPWVVPLALQVPFAPEAQFLLEHFIRETTLHGTSHGLSMLLQERIIRPPSNVSQFVSGNSDKAQHFKHSTLGSFFASLFYAIQLGSCTSVELATWDLFHGHMFIHVHEKTSVADIGILFHAKEFPKEYRSSPFTPLLEVGHEKRGGAKDPRTGTKCSINDHDYSLRNYLWLQSTNTLYLLDPTHFEFDRTLFRWEPEFFTCYDRFFSSEPLGDINFFPDLITSIQPLHSFIDGPLRESNTMTEEGHQSHFLPLQIMERKKKNSVWMSLANEVIAMAQSSVQCAENVFLCSLKGIPRTLQLFNALQQPTELQPESLSECLACVCAKELEELEQNMSFTFLLNPIPPCLQHVQKISCPLVFQAIQNRKTDIENNQKAYNAAQLQALLDLKIEEPHAHQALSMTAFSGLWSSYKSKQLLAAAFSKYREPEDLAIYGDLNYSLEYVNEIWCETFYSWATLQALQCIFKKGMDQSQAIIEAKLSIQRAMDEKMRLNLNPPEAPAEAQIPFTPVS